jgi:hypothetical protein
MGTITGVTINHHLICVMETLNILALISSSSSKDDQSNMFFHLCALGQGHLLPLLTGSAWRISSGGLCYNIPSTSTSSSGNSTFKHLVHLACFSEN